MKSTRKLRWIAPCWLVLVSLGGSAGAQPAPTGDSGAEAVTHGYACIIHADQANTPNTAEGAHRSCIGSMIPSNGAYPDQLPYVDKTAAILIWFEKLGGFIKPSSDTPSLSAQGKTYLAPSDPNAMAFIVRFTLRDFPADQLTYETPVTLTLGNTSWFVRWYTPTRPRSCVSEIPDTFPMLRGRDTSNLLPGNSSAELARVAALRRVPAPCRNLSPTEAGNDELPRASSDEYVHAWLERDGKRLKDGAPEYKNFAMTVFDSNGNTLGQGAPVSEGGQQVRLTRASKLPSGARLTVKVAYNNIETTRALRLSRRYSWYGTQGLWMPLGLFGSNFDATNTGATLAALPIGLAWGERIHLSDTFYIGGSVIGNYVIHPKVDLSGKDTGDFALLSVSAGFLVDINNLVYVGGTYGWTFVSDTKDPGFMFVIGAAPGLLDIAKGK